MTVYSHSRLSCYEQCPQKYKLKYVDKVESEVEETVESFLGSRVHKTLEKLYRDLMYQKMNTIEELLSFLDKEWVKNWSDDIIIVNNDYNQDNYLKMAKKYIVDYYNRYYPFNQSKTIALEEHIIINLDENKGYKLQGYIDRLAETKDGFYEIHDYKTNSRLPLADYIKNDRQLALYMIGVKNIYPDVKNVRLIWHFLKFDKEIDSTRSEEELEQLKIDTIKLIDNIEEETEYKPRPGYICEWCEYQSVCTEWKHIYIVRDKTPDEYMNEPGVKLVDRYAELKNKQKQLNNEIDAELDKIEEALIKYAEREKISCVFGSTHKVRIKTNKRCIYPSKHTEERKKLEETLKKHGLWEEVAQLDTSALNRIIDERQYDKELMNTLKKYIEIEITKRLYLSKKNDNTYDQ
ncbi:MAG: PD-(D/E)XK nuclease family protein [Candidatus Thermoplasmatota archaeon]